MTTFAQRPEFKLGGFTSTLPVTGVYSISSSAPLRFFGAPEIKKKKKPQT